jgi:hypothetical protein
MSVFNNPRILKSGQDVALGAVFYDGETFNYEVYENLMAEKIQDLIDFYVGYRLKTGFGKVTTQEILDDLAVKVSEKLRVSVLEADIYGITEAITSSEMYGKFLVSIKEGFDSYEKMIDYSYNVPVTSEQQADSYYSEENVIEVFNETNIDDFIETLSVYELPILL